MSISRRGLVVGNYCHDKLIKDDIILTESLGGAVSFISSIFTNLSINCDYISKVGTDFNYHHSVFTPPTVVSSSLPTTLFHAHFTSVCPPTEGHPTPDRTLKRVSACDPINPSDLPKDTLFGFGLAVGVGGEILPETLEKMIDICDVVFVDIQGLIREFDACDGTVKLVELRDTRFYPLLSKIGFLKASAEEAEFMDVEEVRKMCCVVITYGESGCKVYWSDGEVEISPFETHQVDPTGAGDSLLGGFVAGLAYGLSVPDAALVGNLFGSLTVGHLGLPKFDPKLLQRIKDEVKQRKSRYLEHHVGGIDDLCFTKLPGHEQFYASLNAARQVSAVPQERESDQRDGLNSTTKDWNLVINNQWNGDKFLYDPAYHERMESVEGIPR